MVKLIPQAILLVMFVIPLLVIKFKKTEKGYYNRTIIGELNDQAPHQRTGEEFDKRRERKITWRKFRRKATLYSAYLAVLGICFGLAIWKNEIFIILYILAFCGVFIHSLYDRFVNPQYYDY